MGGGLTCLPGQGAHYLTNMGVRADMGDTPLPAPSSFPPVSCLIHTETHIHTQTHTHRHTHRDIHTHIICTAMFLYNKPASGNY